MELDLIRHTWGYTGDWRAAVAEVGEKGYVGIEVGMVFVGDSELHELGARTQEAGLDLIAQVFSNEWNGPADVDTHFDSLRKQIDRCLPLNPRFFNAHSGSDAWTHEAAVDFFSRTLELEMEIGVPITHETHRHRYMFNPRDTHRLLRDLPELKLTADLSHWVCVCEGFEHFQSDALEAALAHAFHVHGRVGYDQGPQVPDPRAPEYEDELTRHEAWWDRIWDHREATGSERSTFTPEYGPPPYLHTELGSQEPVAQLDELCDWQANREKRRFAARRSHTN